MLGNQLKPAAFLTCRLFSNALLCFQCQQVQNGSAALRMDSSHGQLRLKT